MDIRFSCLSCGQHLAVDQQCGGTHFHCPMCGYAGTVPQPASIQAPYGSSLASTPGENGRTCPVCWLPLAIGEVMHIAVHDSLRGDPVLGDDAPQRFHATRFNDLGQALDGMGLPCPEMACPHCRRKLPPGFLDSPHHIISLVGDQSAGKSYYLSVLAKTLPASLYTHFGVLMQDADPAGNGPLNDMKKVLFSAQTPAQAKLAKTQLEGAMYERLPRQGRQVALPKPFVYSLGDNRGNPTRCALVFYDNAGEHFQPGINVVEQPGAQHVASASAIMFLFDPFNSPEFRRRLGKSDDPQLEKSPLDQQDTILAEMRTRIQATKHLHAGCRIETPLAVLVGKCDAWLHLLNRPSTRHEDSQDLAASKEFGHLNGFPFIDPLKQGKLSLQGLENNSRMVRELLWETCPTVVANAEALSAKVRYFPVSAFGHTPLKIGPGDYVPDPRRLSPFLVEIPPLWILTSLCPSLVPTQ